MSGTPVCSNCQDLDLNFEWARASVVATPFMLEVIHRYKYSRALWYEPFLAELLVRGFLEGGVAPDWDAIVPVPLHPARLREREFNQAERLAERLAAVLNVPVARDWVRRVIPTRTQALLDRRQRSKNVSRAFAVTEPRRVAGRRLAVLDDVFTTGATTSALSRVLRQTGAESVVVWTLARGL